MREESRETLGQQIGIFVLEYTLLTLTAPFLTRGLSIAWRPFKGRRISSSQSFCILSREAHLRLLDLDFSEFPYTFHRSPFWGFQISIFRVSVYYSEKPILGLLDEKSVSWTSHKNLEGSLSAEKLTRFLISSRLHSSGSITSKSKEQAQKDQQIALTNVVPVCGSHRVKLCIRCWNRILQVFGYRFLNLPCSGND